MEKSEEGIQQGEQYLIAMQQRYKQRLLGRTVCYASLIGQLKRYERQLTKEARRGKKYGPYFISGHSYNRRKFKGSMRNWQALAGKWNITAIRIQLLTGQWPTMPDECGGA